MGSKYSATHLQGVPTASSVNINLDDIETALGRTISRYGDTPNTMQADLDMNNHHIYNLADPTSPDEPAKHGYVSTVLPQAQHQADLAKGYAQSAKGYALNSHNDSIQADSSASAAAISASNASDSASNASGYESQAKSYRNDAQTAATGAASSESNAAASASSASSDANTASSKASSAATSASNAATSESNASSSASAASSDAATASSKASAASTSASNAASSASASKDWATKKNTPVSGGEYSAYYWAQKAMQQVGLKASDDATITGNWTFNNSITGTIDKADEVKVGSNYGSITVSTNAPTGGSNGDIWLKI